MFVLNNLDQFVRRLSIGDIQWAIIKNLSLDTLVANILKPNPRIESENHTLGLNKDEMIRFRMEFLPFIEEQKK